jgi:TRAP-type C4-dicarboxylate transport system substrate-binding protein
MSASLALAHGMAPTVFQQHSRVGRLSRHSGDIAERGLVAEAVGTCAPSAPIPSAGAASARPLTLQFAVADDRGRPSQDAVDDFVELVALLSDGSIVIEPAFDTGGDTPGLVIRGDADLALVASREWDLVGVTTLQALQAPFLITDDTLAAAVAQGGIASQAMEGLAEVGVVGLAMWPEDLRHPFSFVPNKPLLSPADFEGKTILVQASAISLALVEALGAAPYSGTGDERQAAVDAGRLHGAESGFLQGASLPGTPTATGNVTFYPKFQVLVANGSAFDGLSDAQREILRAAASGTQRVAIETHPKEVDAAVAWCAAGGTVALATDDQVAAFESATDPIFKWIANDARGAELIAAIQATKASTEPALGAASCTPVASP